MSEPLLLDGREFVFDTGTTSYISRRDNSVTFVMQWAFSA